jgi:Pectinacetylesterase
MVWWTAWVGCTPDDGMTGMGETPAPVDGLAAVLGDCDGTLREPDPYPNQMVEGDELERVLLDAPGAVCNDGSPGVIYVRAASDPALETAWSLHVQGGGACATWEDCQTRWCGSAYYDASKMSSDWAPPSIGGLGIYDADPANLLAGANHVFFYYCTSDSWAGRAEVTYLPADGSAGSPYTMFRAGHSVMEAAIAALESGVTSDLGTVLPPLTTATQVVFSGTSAGSDGARRHVDWLEERLSAHGAAVVGLFDAAINPAREALPPEGEVVYESAFRALWEADQSQNPAPFYDESCVAHYAGTGDEYLCADTSYVMMNHITTPFFARQDLQDLTGLAESLAADLDAYEESQAETLALLANLPAIAIETVTVAPGVYGPSCGQHVALETNDWWRTATVAHGEEEYTFQRAALEWYAGSEIAVIDDPVAGEGAGPRSSCLTIY